MDASTIAQMRQQLNWSRGTLAHHAGMTARWVRLIETGARTPTPEQDAALTEALGLGLGLVRPRDRSENEDGLPQGMEVITVSHAVLAGVEVTRTYHWRGLRPGDRCRVRNLPGIFHFRFHHVDERQEYVEVYGPVNSNHSYTKIRCVAPDRLRTAKNRQLQS